MPAKKEKLKQYIETRNNKKYIYESTSKIENNKKTTKTRYIGRQDPNTNQIIEKKPRKTKKQRQTETTNKLTHPQNGITSKEHGSIHLLDKIQNKIGLETDLTTAFGEYGKTILALAFTQALDPGAFADIEHTLQKTTIPERFNIKNNMSSPRISEITHTIGESTDCIDLYFNQRLKRSTNTIAWNTTTNGTHSEKTGLAEWAPSKDEDNLKQIKIG